MNVSPRKFALGVGLTNACNLSCAHCYRTTGNDALDFDDVLAAIEAIPTRSVNFGTGENALHPRFAELVEELARRGITVTLTTNGFSAAALPEATLAKLRDVEFSIDYPSEEAHDAARGAGNWSLIEQQMARCAALGVPTTIICVLMSTNWKALPELASLAGRRGAMLRVNVYQSVRGGAFALSFDQFWGAWRAALEVADLVTCGEPIVRAMLGIPKTDGAGCGVETVRITPRGAVVPCVYGADTALRLEDLGRLGPAVVEHETFRALRAVPDECSACPHVATCGGGCASRRLLKGGLDRPDEYCPILRERPIELRARHADAGRALPKASSACTTILKPRVPTAGDPTSRGSMTRD